MKINKYLGVDMLGAFWVIAYVTVADIKINMCIFASDNKHSHLIVSLIVSVNTVSKIIILR